MSEELQYTDINKSFEAALERSHNIEEDLTKSISVFELDKETKKYKAIIKELDILKPGDKTNKEDKLKLDMNFNSNMIVE